MCFFNVLIDDVKQRIPLGFINYFVISSPVSMTGATAMEMTEFSIGHENTAQFVLVAGFVPVENRP